MQRILRALIVMALAWAAPASAHTRSETHAVWEIDGKNVDLILTIPEVEAARIGDTDDAIKGYLVEHIYPQTGETRCALAPPVETLSATAGFKKYDFTFTCPSATDLALHFGAFFDLIASHVDFAQIQDVAAGAFTEQLFTAEHQTVQVSGEAEQLRHAGFREFVGMGVMHIFTGVDHMAFLVGLVLISRRLRDLVFVVTGFTVGHSLTLALAVTGVLRPHAEYIDALVALTIALIGAENLVVATHKPRLVAAGTAAVLGAMVVLRMFGVGDLPLLLILGAGLFSANYLMVSGQVRDAGRLRLVITVVFGLIHGFGFAANLLEMQLPTDRLAELLVGFNLGVEVGQLTLVIGVTAFAWLSARLRVAPPRAWVVDIASAALVAVGVYWFVERSFA